MKNIIRIARNDIHNIRKNVIALIVIFGITIVPSLSMHGLILPQVGIRTKIPEI